MSTDASGFEEGDLIYRPYDRSGGGATNASTGGRFVYHYGVYIGKDEVIDFTKNDGIRKCSCDKFASGCKVSKKRANSRRSEEKIVETATYYYKNPDEWDPYSLPYNNCEHFAQFCVTGVKKSTQVESASDLVESVFEIGKGIFEFISGSEVKNDDYASLGVGRQMENREQKSYFENDDHEQINRSIFQEIEKAQERSIFQEIEKPQERSIFQEIEKVKERLIFQEIEKERPIFQELEKLGKWSPLH